MIGGMSTTLKPTRSLRALFDKEDKDKDKDKDKRKSILDSEEASPSIFPLSVVPNSPEFIYFFLAVYEPSRPGN